MILQKETYHLIKIIAVTSMLTVMAGVSITAKAETSSADEAAWLQHLKQLQDKDGLRQNGGNNTNLINPGWTVIPGAGDKTVVITSQDIKFLTASLSGPKKKPTFRKLSLNYQAELSEKLVYLKFFYNF